MFTGALPRKNVLCQEDIAGMRTDFTVPHRKIEQMTELTGTAADEALTKAAVGAV